MSAQQQEEEIEQQPAEDAAPKPLEVDLSEDSGGDDEEAAPEKPSKKERRENFRRETLGRVQAAEERSAALERQLAELRGQIQGFQAQSQARPRQEQEPAADPALVEADGIEAQQHGILAQLRAQGVSPDEVDRLTRQFRSLDKKRQMKLAEAAARSVQATAPQGLTHEDIANMQLAAEFPDVFQDQAKMMRARAELMDMIRAGKPYNIATAREAAMKVRGPQRRVPPANEADRSRFTSVSTQAGGATGGKFQPTRAQLNAAKAFTQHLTDISDEERVRIWANKVGKKHKLI